VEGQRASAMIKGWKAIFDLYTRECSRRDAGIARIVPKLRESYVLCDSWTKLNVMPAKIMQVSLLVCFLVFSVLLYSCLYSKKKFCQSCTTTLVKIPHPVTLKVSLCYLEACNKIFEKGLLSHEKVCDPSSKVINSIKQGFAFFTEWHAGLSKDGTKHTHIIISIMYS